MPSVEELLNQDSEEVEAYTDTGIEYCTVDDDTRLVTIPDKYKKLGVESDEKAKRVWFRFPKIVGNNGIDLSAISVRVNFRNANGDGDIYMVEDLTVDGDYVVFSWELSRKVTAYKGNISFVVCAVKSSTTGAVKNEWNTTLNKDCEVLEGLEVTEQIAQENPDIIEYILANLGGSVSAEEIATAIEEYMIAHPPSGMTAEEKAQLQKNTEDISSLSEDIANLKQNGTGSGVTTDHANTLWAILQKTAFAEQLTDEELTAFKTAWGIEAVVIPATGISLDKTTLSFTDSATQTLVATVEPSDTTDKVVWTSNAESVATVTNGVVKPLSNGSAIITATCGSVSATCSVTVYMAGEEQVTLTSISVTYTGGDVAVGTLLNDLTGITVTATYSDGSTTEVTDYTLSGTISEGSNTITVSYDGKTTTFTITGVAEDTPKPLYGTYWPPKGAVTDWNNHTWDGVDNFAYTRNSSEYIDAGLPKASFVRLDKLQGTVYIRTLSNNQYGSLTKAYQMYANSDGEVSTGGFTEVVPTVTRSLGTMVVNDVTYYFVLFKFEIPSGQYGYFVSLAIGAASGYFISSDENVTIDADYKQYYTLFTSDPTDRITEGATEVN